MRTLTLTLLLALAAGGCTFEDGVGFALLSGKLYSTFPGAQAASARMSTDGWFKSDNSFELKLSAMTLKVRDLRLQGGGSSAGSSAASSSGSCTFDPANPPAGCSLCHGDHCHCGGKLVSYAELQKQVCGGGTAAASVATGGRLLVSRSQALLGTGTQNPDLTCDGSCELKQGSASKLSVVLDRLQLTAELQDRSVANRLAGKTYKVAVTLDLAGAALSHTFSSALTIDRDSPYMLDLSVKLPVTDTLLDGIEWHKLAAAGDSITIDSTNNKSAGETIVTSLASTALQVVVTRDE